MLKRILIGIFLLIEVTSFSQIDLLKSTLLEKSIETEYFNRPTNFKQSIHLADSLYAVYLMEPFYFKVEQSTSISDGLSLVLNLYHKALDYKPKSTNCQKKIEEVELLFKTKTEAELDAQLVKIIKKADVFFVQKNFEAAKELYMRALVLRSDYEYPKMRLMEIDKILKSYE
jgi:tetratricopeptide (TPR) repeat protein